MSSETIRSTISEKNRYYISKHRYLELRHFCLQYPEWKENYAKWSTGMIPSGFGLSRSSDYADPTEFFADLCARYSKKMDLIKDCAYQAEPELASYIIKAVTEDKSYTWLLMNMSIPCGKDMYYDRYRKFFWILDKLR